MRRHLSLRRVAGVASLPVPLVVGAAWLLTRPQGPSQELEGLLVCCAVALMGLGLYLMTAWLVSARLLARGRTVTTLPRWIPVRVAASAALIVGLGLAGPAANASIHTPTANTTVSALQPGAVSALHPGAPAAGAEPDAAVPAAAVPAAGSGLWPGSAAGWALTTRPASSLPRIMGAAVDRGRVVVGPGDTLWGIAAHHLGPDASNSEIEREWRLWYKANAETVGPDPNVLRPGLELRPPS